MSITFLDRLEASDHLALKEAIEYAAESGCVDGMPETYITDGCDCLACKAGRLRRKLWPDPKFGGALAVVDRLLRRDGVIAASLTVMLSNGTKEIAGLPVCHAAVPLTPLHLVEGHLRGTLAPAGGLNE